VIRTSDRPTIPTLWSTATVPVYGHLSWVGWFWAGAGVVLAIGLVLAGRFGELDDSLWQDVTNVLAWVTFAAGVTTVPVYGPIFAANGMTRHRLARSAIVAAAAVCLLGGLAAAAGYTVEHLVFRSQGWPHVVEGGGGVDGALSIAGLTVGYVATLTCFYASGWLVGIAYLRLGWVAFIVSLVPAAIPLAATQLLLGSGPLMSESPLELPLAVGIAGSLVIAAAAAAVATAVGRGVTYDP
jgi:hypothetical protein